MYTSIGIILPSRGLIFAEVIKSIEEQISPLFIFQYHISINKTIPDCLNSLVSDALQQYHEYLLFIEEDTVPPDGSIDAMIELARKQPKPCVVAVDYPLQNGASSIWRSKKDNTIQFCGFGCTLVDARIFYKLKMPFFRTDMELMMGEGIYGDETRWQKSKTAGYGKHDIHFFKTVVEAGYEILQLPKAEAKHLKILDYGKQEHNEGIHKIGLKADKVSIRYML